MPKTLVVLLSTFAFAIVFALCRGAVGWRCPLLCFASAFQACILSWKLFVVAHLGELTVASATGPGCWRRLRRKWWIWICVIAIVMAVSWATIRCIACCDSLPCACEANLEGRIIMWARNSKLLLTAVRTWRQNRGRRWHNAIVKIHRQPCPCLVLDGAYYRLVPVRWAVWKVIVRRASL